MQDHSLAMSVRGWGGQAFDWDEAGEQRQVLHDSVNSTNVTLVVGDLVWRDAPYVAGAHAG